MKQRYYSLDVFRGATVAFMILVNNPGSWAHIFAPLKHAPWHGCTATDLVFPFFLFAVGNALAFVMPAFEEKGSSAFLKKVLKRTLLIFLIGLFLNWSPFVQWVDNELALKHWVNPNNPQSGIRLLGVLQRIALCYCLASLSIFYFKIRGAFVFSAIILFVYWFACWVGNPADPYSLEGWFGTDIDKTILGVAHMYKGEGVPFDPEGLVSTPPAIVQVIFGYFVGDYIQKKGRSFEMLSNLFVAGCVLAFAGLCWDLSFPINKKIWTSSYVLYSTGLAILVLSVLIYLIEFRSMKGAWSKFFNVFGKNPLFIFVLSGFLPRFISLFRWEEGVDAEGRTIFTSFFPWFYHHLCKPVSENLKLGSLLYALCIVTLMWLIAWWMDKKRWYIKV